MLSLCIVIHTYLTPRNFVVYYLCLFCFRLSTCKQEFRRNPKGFLTPSRRTVDLYYLIMHSAFNLFVFPNSMFTLLLFCLFLLLYIFFYERAMSSLEK